jgi:protein required for attachment to host cells
MKNWLVVANAARARVLEMSDKGDNYVHVADLVHPESRQKAAELGGDKAGHVTSGKHGTGSSEYRPRTDVHEREHEQFAHELAHMLNGGVASGRCAGLVLVASNPFLGHLKAQLDTQARNHVLRTVASDYTALDDRELAQRLAAA